MIELTGASYEALEENLTTIYVLLGGVERFGRMIPELIYSGHLKEPHLVPDTKAPCRRYAVVATWPEEIGLI
uniref:Uncharacterized protein n=1 Tax=Setaria digitata TaxID=48799 RepID=A0A915PQI8_9BILA